MKQFNLVICFLGIIAISTGVKLPSSFKKCSRNQADFNSCVLEAIESALRQLNKPFKEIGLPSLHPLEIPLLSISGNGPVGFEQIYKNVKLFGMTDCKCSKAELNFENKKLFVECSTPLLKMDFDYEVNGKVLLLPLVGKGPGTITLENVGQTFLANLEEYENKNKKHYKVVSSKITMNPSLITFKLENLFNGDKTLSDNIHRVMNENWKILFADVKASYEEAFAQIFSGLFNNVLSRVPAEELF